MVYLELVLPSHPFASLLGIDARNGTWWPTHTPSFVFPAPLTAGLDHQKDPEINSSHARYSTAEDTVVLDAPYTQDVLTPDRTLSLPQAVDTVIEVLLLSP